MKVEAEAKVLIIQALLALMLDSSKDGNHPGSFSGPKHLITCRVALLLFDLKYLTFSFNPIQIWKLISDIFYHQKVR
jgi:hypothetical protein